MHLGVIEGFYGQSWSSVSRTLVFDWLAKLGLTDFVYAPKSARGLRAEWAVPWSDASLDELQQQSAAARARQLRWGVGLTPLGLQTLDSQSRGPLRDKLAQIRACQPELLCLLFDDMRGDDPKLAMRQLAIIDEVAAELGDQVSMVVCPTYYSRDPILEQIFGARPKRYWQELGEALDPRIGFFWTGEKVCAERFVRDDLESIADAMQRQPVLWDNYPVNDSRKLCDFLRLEPFQGREAWLAQAVAGHYANPMNQALASLLPLATLAPIYQQREAGYQQGGAESLTARQRQAWQQMLAALVPDPDLVCRAVGDFAHVGLADMGAEAITGWRQRFAAASAELSAEPDKTPAHPLGLALYREITDWLDGEYAFDEACLTD